MLHDSPCSMSKQVWAGSGPGCAGESALLACVKIPLAFQTLAEEDAVNSIGQKE